MASHDQLSRFNREVFEQHGFEPRESRLRKAYEMFDEEPSAGRALDVAAGSGIAAAELTKRGWKVSALDISESLIAQVRSRGIEDARVHDLSSGPLPFDDASFDAVFAGEIIEHLVDTGGFLEELARVLVPGGFVVLTTPNLASLENRLRLLAGLYPRWMDHELSGEGHVRYYTVRTLSDQMGRCGLRVEKVRGNWVPFVPQGRFNDLSWSPIARTGDWWPSLSQALVVKARRPTAGG